MSLKHSVILGSYCRPNFVRQAIRSVLRQPYENIQLCVSDDGSGPDTIDAIFSEIAHDKRAVVLRHPAEDPAKRREGCLNRAVQRINDAIQHVSGDVVNYLADDDAFHPDRFAVMNELFEAGVVCGYGILQCVDVDMNYLSQLYYPDVVDPLCRIDHNQTAHLASVFKVFPRWDDAIDTASEGHWFQKLSRIWRFVGIPEIVAYKRMHEGCMQRTHETATGLDREGKPCTT